MDTAAVLPGNARPAGTAKRAIPVADPVQPTVPHKLKAASVPISAIIKQAKSLKVIKESSVTRQASLIDQSDTAVFKAYQRAQIAYYLALEKRDLNSKATNDSVSSYYVWALQNRRQIISRQQFTGNIIFILVVILVLSGLSFSAIQFYIAVRSVKKRSASANTSTSFKASLSGIEVSSSVLGVIVLTISIVFFYLYLSKVYPLVSLDEIPVGLPEMK
ncbi:hypothetical protein [Mucilaginibacter endophyticus]|uniref:hypothetical protein n=1 Tax=Mucilaginibacter endophyticus TaxID=2675003 RepID=UPI0012B16E70|nr:hypothetical protein [Mucilaginibacter endophyticus]